MGKFDDIHHGVIGNVWSITDDAQLLEEESRSGNIRLNSRGLIEVELLVDNTAIDTLLSGDDKTPPALYAISTIGPVLLLELRNAGGNFVMSGLKASFSRYESYSAARNVDFDNIMSTRLTELEVFFPGIERWAGVTVSEEEYQHYDDGRLKGFSLRVESAPEKLVAISEGREVGVSAYWSVDGPTSNRSVFAPISLICRSSSPLPLWKLLWPILRMQEILCLAYDGFVASTGGAIDLESKERPPERAAFWNHFLMTVPKGVSVPKSLNEMPMFTFDDIGGMSAVRNWIQLSELHPRLLKPLVNRFRRGLASPELRLMEIAAGIEYWCSVNKKKPGYEWANTTKKDLKPMAIAKHLGSSLVEWLGDPYPWADRFWTRYNKFKHEPSYSVNEGELAFLSSIGYRVLVASALVEISGDDLLATRYFKNHRLVNLGRQAKKYFHTDV